MDPPYKNPPHLFNEFMAEYLLDSARYVMRESKIETFEEFISSDALLCKVGRKFETSSKAKRAASSKGKSANSSKGKSAVPPVVPYLLQIHCSIHKGTI